MNENKVTISLELFEELVRTQEKLNILKRMYETLTIITDSDVRAVLGVEKASKAKE